jgi:hypothetical protein
MSIASVFNQLPPEKGTPEYAALMREEFPTAASIKAEIIKILRELRSISEPIEVGAALYDEARELLESLPLDEAVSIRRIPMKDEGEGAKV